MTYHRCTEAECPYLGQSSDMGCLCHKTDEQMLRESHAELLAALKDLLPGKLCSESYDLPDHEYVAIDISFGALKRARAAIAGAESVA